MAKFVFHNMMTGEEIKDTLQKDLGPAFRVELKKKRMEIVQDALRACAVQCRQVEGRTVCQGPYGYIPSAGVRSAIILGALAMLFVIGQIMGYLVIGIGVIPMIILMLIMKAPSQELVGRVTAILQNAARK
jgi:hypothetical protein